MQPANLPRRPDLQDGPLSLWTRISQFGKSYYKIAEHLPGVPCIYTTVSTELNGAKLSPHEVLTLYKGGSIETEMTGPRGRYTVFLAVRSIEMRSYPEIAGKETRMMTIAMIFPLLRLGKQFGYKIDRITVPDTIGSPSAGRVKLKPEEALMLLQGKTMTLGQNPQYTVKLSHVTEKVLPDRISKTARFSAKRGLPEKRPITNDT